MQDPNNTKLNKLKSLAFLASTRGKSLEELLTHCTTNQASVDLCSTISDFWLVKLMYIKPLEVIKLLSNPDLRNAVEQFFPWEGLVHAHSLGRYMRGEGWQIKYLSFVNPIYCAFTYTELIEIVDNNNNVFQAYGVLPDARYLGRASQFDNYPGVDIVNGEVVNNNRLPHVYNSLDDMEKDILIPDYPILEPETIIKHLWVLFYIYPGDIGFPDISVISQSENFGDVVDGVKKFYEEIVDEFINDVIDATGNTNLKEISQEVIDEFAIQKGYMIIPFTVEAVIDYFNINKFVYLPTGHHIRKFQMYRAVLMNFPLS